MSSVRFVRAEPPFALARPRFGPWLLGDLSGTIAETITLTDDVAAGWAAGGSIAETVTLSDGVSAGWAGTVPVADSVTLSDGASVISDFLVGISESITLSDAVGAFVNTIPPPSSGGLAIARKLSLPSAFQSPDDGGRARAGYWTFWEAVRRILIGQGGIICLPPYTVATLPPASETPGGVIYVTDGSSDRRLAISDGTDWRFPDGNIVT